jgi:hypothetical protein
MLPVQAPLCARPHPCLLPAAAAALGYYDGSGQRGAAIDFKSVCANGTSGIIVVPPSTDKEWIRAPWDEGSPVTDIPLSLLDAVARPRAAGASTAAAKVASTDPDRKGSSAPVTLVFVKDEDAGAEGVPPQTHSPAASSSELDTLVLPDRTPLLAFGYFVALMSGRWTESDDAPLRVPCDRQPFELLLHVARTGELPLLQAPTPDLLRQLEVLADMLLASTGVRRAVHVPSLSRLCFHADLYELSPEWWLVNAEEEAAVRAALPQPLLAIDAHLASSLACEPVAKDGRWLFPHLRTRPTAAAGSAVLAADPVAAVEAALPPLLLQLLRRFADRLLVAGGGVLGAAAVGVEPGSDWDVFVHSTDASGANAVLAAMKEALEGSHDVSVSKGAVTFLPREASGVPTPWERVYGLGAAWLPDVVTGLPASAPLSPPPGPSAAMPPPVALQLVRCLYRDPSQVLQSFDLAPCKVLARFASSHRGEGVPPILRVEALPAWLAALRRKAFWVDTAVWGTASPSRVLKYVAKGFEAALPGVRREAIFRPPTGDIRKGDGSLRALFEAEVALHEGLYEHTQVWPPPARLAPPPSAPPPPLEQRDEEEEGREEASGVAAARGRARGGDDNGEVHEGADEDGGGGDDASSDDGRPDQARGVGADDLSDGAGPFAAVREAGVDAAAPLSVAEARAITDVLSGAVRLYQLSGGYNGGDVEHPGYGGYAFHGSGGSECDGCNDPDT